MSASSSDLQHLVSNNTAPASVTVTASITKVPDDDVSSYLIGVVLFCPKLKLKMYGNISSYIFSQVDIILIFNSASKSDERKSEKEITKVKFSPRPIFYLRS